MKAFGTLFLCAIIVGCLLFLLLGVDWPDEYRNEPARWIGSAQTEQPAPRTITAQHYSKLKVGMSYRQAVSAVGREGEELSRSFVEGVDGVFDSIETIMYQWANGDGSNMNAIFQNDKLAQKSQFCLR